MRRVGLLLTLMSVVLVGTVALQTPPVAVAQEATPAPGEGVTFEALAAAPGISLPEPRRLVVDGRQGLSNASEDLSRRDHRADPEVRVSSMSGGTISSAAG